MARSGNTDVFSPARKKRQHRKIRREEKDRYEVSRGQTGRWGLRERAEGDGLGAAAAAGERGGEEGARERERTVGIA